MYGEWAVEFLTTSRSCQLTNPTVPEGRPVTSSIIHSHLVTAYSSHYPAAVWPDRDLCPTNCLFLSTKIKHKIQALLRAGAAALLLLTTIMAQRRKVID